METTSEGIITRLRELHEQSPLGDWTRVYTINPKTGEPCRIIGIELGNNNGVSMIVIIPEGK